MSEKLKEILENYFYAYAGGRNEKTIDQAELQIKQLIKGKIAKKPIWDTTGVKGKMPIGLKLNFQGYNQAIDDFTKLIDEV